MPLGQNKPIGGRGIGRPLGRDLGTLGLGALSTPPVTTPPSGSQWTGLLLALTKPA